VAGQACAGANEEELTKCANGRPPVLAYNLSNCGLLRVGPPPFFIFLNFFYFFIFFIFYFFLCYEEVWVCAWHFGRMDV
jgi:hypothetical protein